MNKKNSKIVLFIFIFFSIVILLFASSDINLKISKELIYKKDINITNISIYSISNGAFEKSKVDYYGDELVGTITLPSIDSEISYLITISNESALDKCLLWLQNKSYSNNNIQYIISDYKLGDLIPPKNDNNIIITFKYKQELESINDDVLDFDIKLYFDTIDNKKSNNKSYISYHKKQVNFLDGPLKKDEIEEISFSNNLSDINTNDTYFDVSENKDNSIKAYYIDKDNNGLYEIIIYSKDTIMIKDLSFFCSNLINLKSFSFKNLDTSEVTSMSFMFNNCNNLSNISFFNNNTIKITDISYMFNNCRSITSVHFDIFANSKLVNMSGLFRNCKNLINITFANINTKNVKYMESMFEGCSKIQNLYLSSFDTSNVINTNNMFNNCSSLEKVYVSNSFKLPNIIESKDMFKNCTNLKGQCNTVYNNKHIDSSYAKIDICDNTKGYFTMN